MTTGDCPIEKKMGAGLDSPAPWANCRDAQKTRIKIGNPSAIPGEDDMTRYGRLTAGLSNLAFVSVFAIAIVAAPPVRAGELPKPTQDMLKALKLDASILDGLDQELKIPKGWIAKAKKEGQVRFSGTLARQEWPVLKAVFEARYPFVKIEHQRSSRVGRVEKPLIAFRQGRVITDIIAAVGATMKQYREAKALTDLRDIPNFSRTLPNMRGKDGLWVGERLKYWCMAYNTTLLKKKDLPKRWEDILTTKALHKRNIGVSNRPHNWILPLWLAKGEAWTRNYVDQFFSKVQPQLRKEGARAIVALAIAGEFHASMPSVNSRVFIYAQKGAPISWHCPEPVPVTVSSLVVMKGTTRPYSVKLFLNWFLSKEGQVAQFYAASASPVHAELQDKGLVSYAGTIKGKKTAVRTPESLIREFPKVHKVWTAAWVRAGGPVAGTKIVKVKTVLTAVKRGGRQLGFKVGGGEHKAKVSGSRTEVMIGGKPGSRGKLKVGMACEIAYLGNGNEARKIACK
jgi:iron(III) transport system substrate-binding protein